MAKKSSFIEDLIEISAALPWKFGVLLAVISYFGLHHVATMQNAVPTAPGSFGEHVGKQVYITIATFMQYVMPLAFLLGSALSFSKRKHRSQLIEKQSGIESVRAMSWQDFELLVGEAFRLQGYSVEERGGSAPDGGIDLILRKDGKKTLVQCKRWKTYFINVSLVRELFGVMAGEKADACIFVTSGTYTIDAVKFAQGKAIQLIDGEKLVQLVQRVRKSNPKTTQVSGRDADPWASGDQLEKERKIETMAPSCPACGSVMVRRVAKKGSNAGNEFWGCPKFPTCRGVR